LLKAFLDKRSSFSKVVIKKATLLKDEPTFFIFARVLTDKKQNVLAPCEADIERLRSFHTQDNTGFLACMGFECVSTQRDDRYNTHSFEEPSSNKPPSPTADLIVRENDSEFSVRFQKLDATFKEKNVTLYSPFVCKLIRVGVGISHVSSKWRVGQYDVEILKAWILDSC